MAKSLSVFCDFDGTITERDMIVTICEKFCPPEWTTIAKEILAQRKSVREGVAELFHMIPSSKKQEILDFARKVMKLRAGFPEFLDFCQQNGLLFTVCSGGIDFFVEPLMAPFQRQIHKIYSIPADFSGPTIALKHPYGCETCGTCKVKVMAEYPETIKILIGDSITDLHGARHANVVFARDRLKGYLNKEKISYHPFETFFDIMTTLQKFSGGKRVEAHQK